MTSAQFVARLAERDPYEELKDSQAAARRWRDVLTALVGAATLAGVITAPTELSKIPAPLNWVAALTALAIGVLLVIAIIQTALAGDPSPAAAWDETQVECQLRKTNLLLRQAQVLTFVGASSAAVIALSVLVAPVLAPEKTETAGLILVGQDGEIRCVTDLSANVDPVQSVVPTDKCPPATAAAAQDNEEKDRARRLAASVVLGSLAGLITWTGTAFLGSHSRSASAPLATVATLIAAIGIASGIAAGTWLLLNEGTIDSYRHLASLVALPTGVLIGLLLAAIYPTRALFNPPIGVSDDPCLGSHRGWSS